jgi:hypothetical protein
VSEERIILKHTDPVGQDKCSVVCCATQKDAVKRSQN